jgi:SET and MYND domain-containing protein 4
MKNNQLAESFVRKAEEFKSEKKYAEALENYNQCLRYAASKSQLLSDAYVGRSRIYLETNQHEQCLENIQLAIDSSCTVEKGKSCKALQVKFLDKIGKIASENTSTSFFTLTQPAHKRVPFIADCLEVRENEIYGRYIMTTNDLQPGDIVVVEEPFYKILGPNQRHTRCSVCLKQNNLNLFPCAKCSLGESVNQRLWDSCCYQNY